MVLVLNIYLKVSLSRILMDLSPTNYLGKREPRQKVLYVNTMIYRIGHLAGELNYLRNSYPDDKYDIELVTIPLESRSDINLAMFEIATRGISAITYCEDTNVLNRLSDFQKDPVLIKDNTLYNLNFYDIYDSYLRLIGRDKHQPFKFSLTEEEREVGKSLRKSLGIPLDAKIITLHAREGGYLPHLSYHSFRDVDVRNYYPAIQYLIEEGFYVVRIGDKSMTRLGLSSPQLIDGPFSEKHSDFFDPYFISESDFYVGMLSGPINIAQGFEVPTLVVNGQICAAAELHCRSIFCPKKIYSSQLDRFLTYFEIANSPIVDTYKTEDFTAMGVHFVENTEEEILFSVKEMNERIKGVYADRDLELDFDNTIRNVHSMVQTLRSIENDPKKMPYYMEVTDTQFSTEFLKANKEFLGHRF